MNKNILIYNDKKTLEQFIGKSDYLKFNTKIYMVYYGKIINPPYFKSIIVLIDDLKDHDLNMIWNMTHQYGHFIILSKYKSYYESKLKNILIKPYEESSNYIMIEKKNNIILYDINDKYRIVEFIIMGTQKGGTTSAQINLNKHPDIHVYKDEIHYFDMNLSKGIEWYKKHFDYKNKIVGEKTPDLMYLNWTFPYIQSLNPSLKILLFLRNPINRAYSHWKMMRESWNETKTFEECINDEQENRLTENKTFNISQYHYLGKGLYYSQIKKLLKWFPKENIMILISEHVDENMNDAYSEIYNFLNIKSYETEYTRERVSSSKEQINNVTYNKLIPFFKQDVEKLEKLIKLKTKWF